MFALAEALGSGKNLDTFDLIDGKYIRLPYEMITADNAEAYENRQ